MKKTKLIDYDSELTEKEIEFAEEVAIENLEETILTEVIETKSVKRNIIDEFCWEVLEGSITFKSYVSKYIRENMKIVFEDSDLNYFDWSFHQYLRDSFIAYSRSILEDVKSGSKDTELQEFVKLGDLENLTFMDIFSAITAKNGKKNFAKYILEKN